MGLKGAARLDGPVDGALCVFAARQRDTSLYRSFTGRSMARA
jgi:hypothetical protein